MVSSKISAQQDSLKSLSTITSPIKASQKDAGDLFNSFIKHKKKDTTLNKIKKYEFTLLPAVGYTLQTGFAGVISGNVGFYNNSTNPSNKKLSAISTNITYSQYNQIIFPLYVNIWTKNAGFNIISDNRFISYPSEIFGLGGHTDPNKDHTINFNQIKLHESVLKRITNNFYGGVGFYYDNFYNIKVLDPQTRRMNVYIQKEIGTKEAESGPVLKLMYDNRLNQINPEKGAFVNFTLRQNLIELGSTKEWASILIDARKYINFPRGSKNTLAFWSYNYLTIAGNPNYLLLPSTGWDDQYNTGRGYVQSRFRGKQMLYFETEYRYRITKNGLLGGVVFMNNQSFNGNVRPYDSFLPGYGAGLRIKLNKNTNTNLCIDYGFGKNSQGIFVNLGEVF